MGKNSKNGCKSVAHQMFKDKAKNRVDDLQGMFTDLQFARRESRTGDVAVLEEQVHQMLREWKAELNEASPTSSLHGGSHASFGLSSDVHRMLQLYEGEDDATSKLADLPPMNPKVEPDTTQNNVQAHQGGEADVYQQDYYANAQQIPMHEFQGDGFKNTLPMGLELQGIDGCKVIPQFQVIDPRIELPHPMNDCLEGATQLEYQQFNMSQDLRHNDFPHFEGDGLHGQSVAAHMAYLFPTICPPASAFLRPKCALWDCPRPAKGSDCFEDYKDYCSSVHAILAFSEGPPGMTPVLRPGGIDLKDGPLFCALTAKTQGKNVGIPVCEGAATAKSPWNAPELFDLSVLEGESIREWLFFDKPRRAFESGNRKQRSLPDYSGRGWHESRKQVLKEFGGLKRSYYMDPQPLNQFEWHLYEYELNYCDACALYRLELKLVDPKKSGKGKLSGVSLVDLQQQMGKLASDGSVDNKRSVKGRAKANQKDVTLKDHPSVHGGHVKDNVGNVCVDSDSSSPADEVLVYGPTLPYGYSIDTLHQYYGT